jgi:SAM-dependent methyltransferase
VSPVLVEPEAGACRAARRLFGFPTVQGTAAALSVPDDSFDAAWCLGVLCTTPDQREVLAELRRAVRPPGRIGLLVFVAQTTLAEDEQPDGNHFPTEDSLRRLLDVTGLRVESEIRTAELPEIPAEWTRRVDAVEEALRARHGHDETWRIAQRQSDQMGRLLGDELVSGVVLSLRRAG